MIEAFRSSFQIWGEVKLGKGVSWNVISSGWHQEINWLEKHGLKN
jgi:hypothetical protein